MARLRFAPPARGDLRAIAEYIAQDSPDRADAFVNRIVERCQILKTSPRMGRLRPEFGLGTRSFPVWPVVVFYRVSIGETNVEVLRVIDGRRDLGTVFTEMP